MEGGIASRVGARAEDRYGLVIVLVILSYGIAAAYGGSDIGRMVMILVQLVTVWLVFTVSEARVRSAWPLGWSWSSWVSSRWRSSVRCRYRSSVGHRPFRGAPAPGPGRALRADAGGDRRARDPSSRR